MTYRPRRGNYITQRRGRYYYRRMVPEPAQDYFGKKVIMIPLTGENDTERAREAQALAARHDDAFQAEIWEDEYPPTPSDTIEMRVGPSHYADGTLAPIEHYRDGAIHVVEKISITDDPALYRKAEKEGFLPMSRREFELQTEYNRLKARFEVAKNEDQRELADLKARHIIEQMDNESRLGGADTVLSVLPAWRAHRNQALTTWKKHTQYASEFAELHGDLPLVAVTKRHIVEYVQHSQTLTYRGIPISPGSVAKRLDSIKALFAYAAGADLVQFSPATGVKAPRDTRPKTSKSWKSFEKSEIQALVAVSTDIWGSRRASRHSGRLSDLTVALQCLIWTGGRPEEICQLRRADIDLNRKAIIITNDESDDDARARMVKNDRSTREIPIHSRLLIILEEHVRRSNSPLFFPTFEPQPTRTELDAAEKSGQSVEIGGRYARPISREWTDYLREKVVPNEPRKVLYSLRHSWAAESRRTGMPEHVRNSIMGHADDNQHASRYGGDADWLETKRQHMERMRCT